MKYNSPSIFIGPNIYSTIVSLVNSMPILKKKEYGTIVYYTDEESNNQVTLILQNYLHIEEDISKESAKTIIEIYIDIWKNEELSYKEKEKYLGLIFGSYLKKFHLYYREGQINWKGLQKKFAKSDIPIIEEIHTTIQKLPESLIQFDESSSRYFSIKMFSGIYRTMIEYTIPFILIGYKRNCLTGGHIGKWNTYESISKLDMIDAIIPRFPGFFSYYDFCYNTPKTEQDLLEKIWSQIDEIPSIEMIHTEISIRKLEYIPCDELLEICFLLVKLIPQFHQKFKIDNGHRLDFANTKFFISIFGSYIKDLHDGGDDSQTENFINFISQIEKKYPLSCEVFYKILIQVTLYDISELFGGSLVHGILAKSIQQNKDNIELLKSLRSNAWKIPTIEEIQEIINIQGSSSYYSDKVIIIGLEIVKKFSGFHTFIVIYNGETMPYYENTGISIFNPLTGYLQNCYESGDIEEVKDILIYLTEKYTPDSGDKSLDFLIESFIDGREFDDRIFRERIMSDFPEGKLKEHIKGRFQDIYS